MLTPGANTDFDLDLAATLARLRIYALSLTRNGDRADDLVQQTVLKALAGRESFQPGTSSGLRGPSPMYFAEGRIRRPVFFSSRM